MDNSNLVRENILKRQPCKPALINMVEQQRRRVEQEITKMVDDMDKTFLRKMQADMHRCAAKCCDDNNSGLDYVQRCIDGCSLPLNRAQAYVQGELEGLQNRLQRCVMSCNDSIKDAMPPNPNDREIAKFTAQFEDCAVKCVDKHIDLLPSVRKAMTHVLKMGAPDASG